MKRFLLVILAGALFVSSAFASITTCPAAGTAYSTYAVGGFTCTSGNLTFGGFTYASSASGTPIPSSAVSVTPITTTSNEGFQFQPTGMSVSNTGSTQNISDITLGYFVTDPFGITDLSMIFDGSFTGTGITGATETYCLNQTTLTGCPSPQIFSVTNPPLNQSNSVTFSAVTSIAISKDFSVASGTNGTATITTISNQFLQVPEPLSCALLGSGIVGLLLLRRRLYKR
ncbi:MAG TPA: PEP-CTERM sorting domain-containing protein [Bryobacteraceae bacterium]|nr:PEP-CTERM sorting domain-containing protein [Bryobacteraceae bacterium]